MRAEELRLLEAMLFASDEPLDEKDAGGAAAGRHRRRGGAGAVAGRLRRARRQSRAHRRQVDVPHRDRPVVAAEQARATETRKLSRAAIETLAIIAYHQPVTRAEIEEIRGVIDLEGHARRAAGDRLDPAARPPQDARPAGDLRHHRAVPVAFRPGGGRRPAGPGRAARNGPAGRRACRAVSACRRRRTTRSCGRTRIRWSPAISTSRSRRRSSRKARNRPHSPWRGWSSHKIHTTGVKAAGYVWPTANLRV